VSASVLTADSYGPTVAIHNKQGRPCRCILPDWPWEIYARRGLFSCRVGGNAQTL